MILADEPTGNLDSVQGREILQLFRDLVDHQDCTVVLVTHDESARQLAHRVHQLVDGQLNEG